jgi:hypothetical protein
MTPRWELSESTWIRSFSDQESPAIDYLVLELGNSEPRPWLDAARESVELIGRIEGVPDSAVIEHALQLDVDFLCLAGDQEAVDSRRLPLRLLVEDSVERAFEHPALFGAAWARRIHGWEGEDPARLTELARRERIFLTATEAMPDPGIVAAIEPFAIALPEGVSPADLAAWNRA